jgi:hypothetical protein
MKAVLPKYLLLGGKLRNIGPYIDYICFSTGRIMQADSRPIQIKNISTELDLYFLQLDSQALLDHPFLVRVRKQLERYDVQLT